MNDCKELIGAGEETRYYVYAKYKNQRKFKALDLKTNEQVENIIKATILKSNEAVRFMQTEAPINAQDWLFELREAI